MFDSLSSFADYLRAEKRMEAIRRLRLLSGNYQGPKRSSIGSSDNRAFKNRVAKRRAKKGYR